MNPSKLTYPLRLVSLAAVLAAGGFRPLRAADPAAASDPNSGLAANDKAIRLDEMEVFSAKTSALTQAPTDSKLESYQPNSVISAQTLNNMVAPTADYATIANMAPSVANVETNGPGLSEAKSTTMRGFDDGQYNVTFDGIPFGDGNDFTHHTTSYFPAKILGQVEIDRGPGTASTIGEATFGGTIALFSKDPRPDQAVVPTLSFGSWSTFLGNLEVNTGVLPSANGASAVASYQYMSTDGYRTYAQMTRNTFYLKDVQPIGRSTTISFVGSFNNIKFNNPGANSYTTIQQFGRNFGQDNNPADAANYYGYNYQTKQTWMDYIGLDSDLGSGWSVNDKVYTYTYNNDSHESPKVSSSKNTSYAAGPVGGDIEGQYKVNLYHAYGDYFLIRHDDTIGTLKLGAWGEYMDNPRYNYYLDYNPAYAAAHPGLALPGGILDPTAESAKKQGTEPGFAWDMRAYLKTVQPFAEYAWRITPALDVDGGVKYVSFDRNIEARVNQTKDLLPLYYNHVYSKTVPYLSANYLITRDWSAYAQAAEGFLAPNLNWLEANDPTLDTTKPEQTVNYQAGTVFKTDRFNADADVYWIDMTNYPFTQQNPNDPNDPNDVFYTDAKGAYYYGFETEATYYLGAGLSVYANGSLNHAVFKKSRLNIPGVPNSTASAGLVYNQPDGFFGSVIGKYVGPRMQYSGKVNPDIAGTFGAAGTMGGYAVADLSIGYGAKTGFAFFRSYKIRLAIDNLLNRDVEVLNSFKGLNQNNTYNPLPMRNYYLTVSGEF